MKPEELFSTCYMPYRVIHAPGAGGTAIRGLKYALMRHGVTQMRFRQERFSDGIELESGDRLPPGVQYIVTGVALHG